MTPESLEVVLFSVAGYEFDGISVMIGGITVLGLIMGVLMMVLALKSKSTNCFNRIYMGSLGTILLSCVSMIGLAFT